MGEGNIRQATPAQSYRHMVFALGLPDGRDSNAYLARAFQHYNWIRRQWRRSGQRSPARGYAEHRSGAKLYWAGHSFRETLSLRSARMQASQGASRIQATGTGDRKSTRLNSSHGSISYAVFC